MIAVEDLMINNYLLYDEDGVKNIRQVTTIGEDAEGFKGKYVRLDKAHATTLEGEDLHIEPIPLTPDVLERLGFEKRDNDTSVDYHIGFNEVTHDWLFYITWIKDFEYPFYRNGKHIIKYVHTLQNICKVFGKDLKFKTT
jgi:hypothetical protein